MPVHRKSELKTRDRAPASEEKRACVPPLKGVDNGPQTSDIAIDICIVIPFPFTGAVLGQGGKGASKHTSHPGTEQCAVRT